MCIYEPYTYLIGWSSLNKWYYGARWAKNCSPNDLWKTYFTSSIHVKKFREIHGDPDVVMIRKTFKTAEHVRKWEEKVQKRLNVIHDERWLNKHHSNAKFCSDGNPETCEKISNSLKGRKRPEKDVIAMRKPKRKGHKQTEEHIEKRRKNIDWLIVPPNGESFRVTNLTKFCIENDLPNGPSNLYGGRTYRGYRAEKI